MSKEGFLSLKSVSSGFSVLRVFFFEKVFFFFEQVFVCFFFEEGVLNFKRVVVSGEGVCSRGFFFFSRVFYFLF